MRRLLALGSGSMLLLTGCGQAEVSTGDLEEQITGQLAKQVGQEPENVTCEDPLPAETGEKVRCTLTDPTSKKEYGLTVTASQVDGDNVRFAIEVDPKPVG